MPKRTRISGAPSKKQSHKQSKEEEDQLIEEDEEELEEDEEDDSEEDQMEEQAKQDIEEHVQQQEGQEHLAPMSMDTGVVPNTVEELQHAGTLPPLATVAVNPGQGLLSAPGMLSQYEYGGLDGSKADPQLHQHINQHINQITQSMISQMNLMSQEAGGPIINQMAALGQEMGGVQQQEIVPEGYDVRLAEYAAAEAMQNMPTDFSQSPAKRSKKGSKRASKDLPEDSLAQRRLKNRKSAAISRKRKKEYITTLEQTNTCLTTERLELQLKVATLTNHTWELQLKLEEMEKQLNEVRAERDELVKQRDQLGLPKFVMNKPDDLMGSHQVQDQQPLQQQ